MQCEVPSTWMPSDRQGAVPSMPGPQRRQERQEAGAQQSVTTLLEDHPKLMGAGGGRNAADPFVIALAIVNAGVVVTEETRSGNSTKPRIPDVCAALSVPCVYLIGFVRLQGWSY